MLSEKRRVIVASESGGLIWSGAQDNAELGHVQPCGGPSTPSHHFQQFSPFFGVNNVAVNIWTTVHEKIESRDKVHFLPGS